MTDTDAKESSGYSNLVTRIKSTFQGTNAALELRRIEEGEDSKKLWNNPDVIISAVLEAYSLASFVVDRQGTVKYFNSAAVSQFGKINFGDPIAFSLRSPKFLETFQRVRTSGIAEKISWDEKNITEVSLEAFISPVSALKEIEGFSGNNQELFLVSVQDFSEHKRLERMRADFVANASHELRTPLASLTGYIETMLGPAKTDTQAQEKFLSIMLDQSRRMGRLIDDLLSLSRIELKPQVDSGVTANLAHCIRHVIDSLTPLARELAVEMDVNLNCDEATVNGEFDELVQVIENLIGNALRYGADGKKVIVSLSRDENNSLIPCWKLSVKDFGPGIETKHLPRLTERFYRVDVETSREMKGTGLGLAIVKHILNRHRARLSIESELGKGALFAVHMPIASSSKIAES